MKTVMTQLFLLLMIFLATLTFIRVFYKLLLPTFFIGRRRIQRICPKHVRTIKHVVAALVVYDGSCTWCKKELTETKRKGTVTDKEFN